LASAGTWSFSVRPCARMHDDAVLAIRRIADAIDPLAFDRIYGAWWDRNIATDAKSAFAASVRRYLAAIS
jgi:hypothetical protein